MSKSKSNDPNHCLAEIYEIRVKGHLHQKRAALFEGLTITCKEDGTTILCGPLPDQTALHGILLRIRNMNLKLISVRQISGNADNPKTRVIGMENKDDKPSVSEETVANSEIKEPPCYEKQPGPNNIDKQKSSHDSDIATDQK